MRAASGATHRIVAITLDERSVVRRSPAIEHERAVAIADLLKENHFCPSSGRAGPFDVHLAIRENRLAMEIATPAEKTGEKTREGSSETIVLPLAPFRRIVKDYFLVCESYYQATGGKGLAQVEAIDVGRRSLHNEGAGLLIKRLAGKVAIDHATARRLFTLICVLHLRA